MNTLIVIVLICVAACIGLFVLGILTAQKDAPARSSIPLAGFDLHPYYGLRASDPAVSTAPSVDRGGPRGRLDLPQTPRSSRALASPLAEFEPPASGRGLNQEDHCADDVAATISSGGIVVDIDELNAARLRRIKRMRADGRRM